MILTLEIFRRPSECAYSIWAKSESMNHWSASPCPDIMSLPRERWCWILPNERCGVAVRSGVRVCVHGALYCFSPIRNFALASVTAAPSTSLPNYPACLFGQGRMSKCCDGNGYCLQNIFVLHAAFV